MSEEKSARPYAAPALQKAFEIFEVLSDYPSGALVSEMAARLGRSVGELFRIVMVMEQAGYLQRCAVTARYTVAYKFLDLAYRATPAQNLVEVARPHMRWLAGETEQSCHLVVLNGGSGLVIAREQSPGLRSFSLRLGAAIDLVKSCSGCVILAFSPPSGAELAIDRAEAVNRTPADRHVLRQRMEAIRQRGHERRKSPITLGVTDISFPLFSFQNSMAGALTIPFVELIDGSEKVDIATATGLLETAAAAISRELGAGSQRP